MQFLRIRVLYNSQQPQKCSETVGAAAADGGGSSSSECHTNGTMPR
jgi:hypothetical protein